MKNTFYKFTKKQQLRKILPTSAFSLVSLFILGINIFFSSYLQWYFALPLDSLLIYCTINFITSTIQLIFYDPGYVEQSDNPYQEICQKCNYRRPQRAHHCSQCEKCVRKFDHHCDIFQSCIACWNMPYFFKFFMTATIIGLFSVILNLSLFFYIQDDNKTLCIVPIAAGGLIVLVTIAAGSALWYQPICRDITQVEDLTNQIIERKSIPDNMKTNLGKLWFMGVLVIGWKFNPQDALIE
ncbi:Palmitoyltransferase [Spironucleus salmonicida]|uniref:Palmitoyltransferase n=1 Tax=Spironucleus salmonicida TaxID=348837 RepID=V6LVZ3_9EUKA|nr:Palmitoyltransferase [Spironucleus salmonicida]|eukprot:EST48418.1 DHHC zinc finger and transmembrane domain-containing protein [Spironucleus salmonicida]